MQTEEDSSPVLHGAVLLNTGKYGLPRRYCWRLPAHPAVLHRCRRSVFQTAHGQPAQKRIPDICWFPRASGPDLHRSEPGSMSAAIKSSSGTSNPSLPTTFSPGRATCSFCVPVIPDFFQSSKGFALQSTITNAHRCVTTFLILLLEPVPSHLSTPDGCEAFPLRKSDVHIL